MGRSRELVGLTGEAFVRKQMQIKREGRKHLSKLVKRLYEERGQGCEMCHQKMNRENLTPHHRHYRNQFCEEPEDIVLLCAECHRGLHVRHKTFRLIQADAPYIDPLWVDGNGDIIPGRKSPRNPVSPDP